MWMYVEVGGSGCVVCGVSGCGCVVDVWVGGVGGGGEGSGVRVQH